MINVFQYGLIYDLWKFGLGFENEIEAIYLKIIGFFNISFVFLIYYLYRFKYRYFTSVVSEVPDIICELSFDQNCSNSKRQFNTTLKSRDASVYYQIDSTQYHFMVWCRFYVWLIDYLIFISHYRKLRSTKTKTS